MNDQSSKKIRMFAKELVLSLDIIEVAPLKNQRNSCLPQAGVGSFVNLKINQSTFVIIIVKNAAKTYIRNSYYPGTSYQAIDF